MAWVRFTRPYLWPRLGSGARHTLSFAEGDRRSVKAECATHAVEDGAAVRIKTPPRDPAAGEATAGEGHDEAAGGEDAGG